MTTEYNTQYCIVQCTEMDGPDRSRTKTLHSRRALTCHRLPHTVKKYSGNQRHAALVGSHCSQLQESESAGKRGVALRTAESKAGLISNEFECRFLKKSGNISEKNELKKKRGNKKRGSIYVQSRVFF